MDFTALHSSSFGTSRMLQVDDKGESWINCGNNTNVAVSSKNGVQKLLKRGEMLPSCMPEAAAELSPGITSWASTATKQGRGQNALRKPLLLRKNPSLDKSLLSQKPREHTIQKSYCVFSIVTNK